MSNEPTRSSVPGSGVLITGGSSGLGRATALLLAEAGRPVAVWGTSETRVHGKATYRLERYGLTADIVRGAFPATRLT